MATSISAAELSRVDCSITHWSQVESLLVNTSGTPKVINLHGNRLRRIDPGNFQGSMASQLVALDLSSNDLDQVPGLAGLPCLRVLNLANNRISNFEGGALEGLPSLRKLIVAHNRLAKLVSLVPLSRSCQLEYLDLRDNLIGDSTELYYLSGLRRLRILFVAGNSVHAKSQGTAGQALWNVCHDLESIDGETRQGTQVRMKSWDLSSLVQDAIVKPPNMQLPHAAFTMGAKGSQEFVSARAFKDLAHEALPLPLMRAVQQPVPSTPEAAPVQDETSCKELKGEHNREMRLDSVLEKLVRAMQKNDKTKVLQLELQHIKEMLARLERRRRAKHRQENSILQSPAEKLNRDLEVNQTKNKVLSAAEVLVQFERDVTELQVHERERTTVVRDLRDAVKAAEVRAEVAESALQALKNDRDKLASERENLQNEVQVFHETALRQSEQLKAAHDERVKLVANYVQENETGRSKLAGVILKLREVQGTLRDVVREVSDLRAKVRDEQNLCHEQLIQTIRIHKAEIARVQAIQKREYDTEVHALRFKVQNLQRERDDAVSETKALVAASSAQMKEMQAELYRAQAAASDAKDYMRDSQERQLNAEERIRIVEAQARAHKEEAFRVKHELASALRVQHARVSLLSEQLRDLENLYVAKVNKLSRRIKGHELEKKQAAQQALDLANTTQRLSEAQQQINQMSQQRDDAISRIASAETALAEAKKEAESARSAVLIKNRVVEDQAETLKHLKATLSVKVSEFQILQREYEAIREVKSDLHNRDQEVARLEDLAMEYRAERNAAREESVSLQQALNSRNEALSQIEAESAKLHAMFTSKLEKAAADAQALISARDLVVDELKKLLVNAQEQSDQAARDRDVRAAEVMQLRMEVSDDVRRLREELSQKSLQLRRAQRQARTVTRKWKHMMQLLGPATEMTNADDTAATEDSDTDASAIDKFAIDRAQCANRQL